MIPEPAATTTQRPAAQSIASTTPCRVLLLEDDAALRERFVRLLQAWPKGQVVAACATLGQALSHLNSERIDLLITDLKLPDGHGTQAIRLLRTRHPKADAMVISVLADDETVVRAIEAGAAGYLLKDADSFELIEAIEELRAGRSPISSAIARIIVRRLNETANEAAQPILSSLSSASSAPSASPPSSGAANKKLLTPREMEILWGIAKGYTYAELAERLGISKQTVPVHVRNIYRKLEASNRSEAVYEASRLGLLRL